MIHIVACANRELYRNQLRDLSVGLWRTPYAMGGVACPILQAATRAAADDPEAVWLLALDAHEQVEAGVRLRPAAEGDSILGRFLYPAGPETDGSTQAWEVSRLLLAPTPAVDPERERRRGLEVELAAAEYVIAHGGRHTVSVLRRDEVAAWLDAVAGGAPRILGAGQDGACDDLVAAWLELDPAAVRAGRDMLGEPPDVRLGYEIEPEDLTAFGALAAAERAVDGARRFRSEAQLRQTDRPDGAEMASALYARHDAALFGARAWMRRGGGPAEGPRQLH